MVLSEFVRTQEPCEENGNVQKVWKFRAQNNKSTIKAKK